MFAAFVYMTYLIFIYIMCDSSVTVVECGNVFYVRHTCDLSNNIIECFWGCTNKLIPFTKK